MEANGNSTPVATPRRQRQRLAQQWQRPFMIASAQRQMAQRMERVRGQPHIRLLASENKTFLKQRRGVVGLASGPRHIPQARQALCNTRCVAERPIQIEALCKQSLCLIALLGVADQQGVAQSAK